MLPNRLGERAEDDAQLRQLAPERRRDRDAVEHRVDRDAGQQLLLVERDAELVERLAAAPDRPRRGLFSVGFFLGAE